MRKEFAERGSEASGARPLVRGKKKGGGKRGAGSTDLPAAQSWGKKTQTLLFPPTHVHGEQHAGRFGALQSQAEGGAQPLQQSA